MFQQLVGTFFGCAHAARSRVTRRTEGLRSILGVELLEARLAPATFLWNPQNNSSSWSDGRNWYNQTAGQQSTQNTWPGAMMNMNNDEVVFQGDVNGQSQNTNCTDDVGMLTVSKVTVTAAYTSTISLPDANGLGGGGGQLTITGTLSFGGVGAIIKGKVATITVNGGLTWTAGTFRDEASVTLGANSTSTISGTDLKKLDGAAFYNDGTLTWTDGDVATALSANSYVANIVNNGTFEMKAAANLGSLNSNSNFSNYGTLKKLQSNTSVVRLPFYNYSGNFYIQAGTIQFADTAQQGPTLNGAQIAPSGLTEMSGGTLKMDFGGYTINCGTFDGVGTVTGDLLNYNGDLKVGLNDGPGTITVTGKYSQTFTAGPLDTVYTGTLEIYISANGASSQLAITDSAKLAGTLKVHNTPYTGTANWTFMTYGSHTGNFSSFSYDAGSWVNNYQWYYFVPDEGSNSYVLEVWPAA